MARTSSSIGHGAGTLSSSRRPRRLRASAPGGDLDPGGEDRAADAGALADRAAVEQDRVAHLRPGLDPAARPDHGPRADRRARRRPPRRVDQHARARSARPASRPGPRGCPSSPAGSARGCRCPSSSRRGAGRAGPSPTSRGKTSRSIETFSPGGIRSSTERSSTYIPALISPGAALAGLLEELEHRALLVAAGPGRRPRSPRPGAGRASPRAPLARGRAAARVRSRSVSTSPLRARKRSSRSSPSCVGGEADRPGGAAAARARPRSGSAPRPAPPRRRAPRAARRAGSRRRARPRSTPWPASHSIM